MSGDQVPEKDDATIGRRSEELPSDYANNVAFESTVWDLKIIFGEFSHKNVEWHTSMTVPWAQAKLMAYYLELNIGAHEMAGIPINIPPAFIPAPPVLPPEDASEYTKAVYRLIKHTHERFFGVVSDKEPME